MKKYVIYKVSDNLYGMPVGIIRDMVVLPHVTPVPQADYFIRGIINLRGKVIPVIDFRKRLGIKSLYDENIELVDRLRQREAEHREWIDELEASVREDREFKLEKDPHRCRFGRWFDGFHTDDLNLRGLLNQFKSPHETIHSLAAEVILKRSEGKTDEALDIIVDAKSGVLNLMIELFRKTYDLLEKEFKELAIVIELESGLQGIIVDKIVSIQNIDSKNIKSTEGLSLGKASELTDKIAELGDDLIMLVDPGRIAEDLKMRHL